MIRLSANISTMFNEVGFLDRFGEASRAGFRAVEFLFPYAFDVDEVCRAVKSNDLEVSVFNLHPGDWDRGERGVAALPGREREFMQSVEDAIPYARALNASQLHIMAGIAEPNPIHLDLYCTNIARAADRLSEEGFGVLIEPISRKAFPGYLLSTAYMAMEVLQKIDHPSVRLQFDIFHQQMECGNVINTLTNCISSIGHIQIAGAPGRHEPGIGELSYDAIFEHLIALGYDGWIGCEYFPQGETVAGLGWINRLLPFPG